MQEDVEATARALERLSAALRSVRRTSVSASTVTALDTLARTGPMRVSDLAAREGISQPGMSALVNRLSDAGWAVKQADDTDRRATLVEITDAGRAALAERHRERTAAVAAGIAELSADQRRALLAACAALDELAGLVSGTVTPLGASA